MERSILQGLRNSSEINNELQGFNIPNSDGTIKIGYADLKPEFFIQCQIAFQIKSDFPDYEIKLEVPTESFKNSFVDINERIPLNNFYHKAQYQHPCRQLQSSILILCLLICYKDY
jgi:hypothetical protein